MRKELQSWHLEYNSNSYKELFGPEALMPPLILKSFKSCNIIFKKQKHFSFISKTPSLLNVVAASSPLLLPVLICL